MSRPELKGVPETLLWPLYNRATEAKQLGSAFKDSLAVKIADQIDYSFEKSFGPPDEGAPLRALGFDNEIRRYLSEFPEATIVALGDGLETQFWRVDNGKLKWISVDLPETIALRKQLLPTHERLQNFECSALDFRWMDELKDELKVEQKSRGVFISAQGLLMYFQRDDVLRLISMLAERFPLGALMFDTAPRWISALSTSRRGWKKTKDYRVPAMPWGINLDELQQIKDLHANIRSLQEIVLPRGRGFVFRRVVPFINRLPLLRNHFPAMVLLRFGSG